MEQSVEKIFTKNVMEKFLHLFCLDNDHKKLGDFENYVFEVYKNGDPYILRVTHSSHRMVEEIISEIDWVNYLHAQKINVPQFFPSNSGKYIETLQVEDGTSFYASLFSKADGLPVRIKEQMNNNKLFYEWGKIIAKMHKATKNYKFPELSKKRPYWDEDELLEIEKYIPLEEQVVIKNSKRLVQEIKKLPITENNFGLIHTDIHSGNFFYDGEHLHVFDFDDCSYIWFTADIAIPLYYCVQFDLMDANNNSKSDFVRRFLKFFIEGYSSEYELPQNWKEEVSLFLRLRDVTLYSILHKKILAKDRDEKLNQLLLEIKGRIEKNESIVKL